MGSSISSTTNIDTSIDQFIQQKPCWKFFIILNVVRKLMLDILHNKHYDHSYIGFPDDPKQLYVFLNLKKDYIKSNLTQKDFDQVFLSHGIKEIYSSDWDLMLVIRIFINLKVNSKFDLLILQIQEILSSDFSNTLNIKKIRTILKSLNFHYVIDEIEELEKGLLSIDFKIDCCKTSAIQYLKSCQQLEDVDSTVQDVYAKSIEAIKIYNEGDVVVFVNMYLKHVPPSKTLKKITNESVKYTCLLTFMYNSFVKRILLKVFRDSNYCGIPKDRDKLYNYLEKNTNLQDYLSTSDNSPSVEDLETNFLLSSKTHTSAWNKNLMVMVILHSSVGKLPASLVESLQSISTLKLYCLNEQGFEREFKKIEDFLYKTNSEGLKEIQKLKKADIIIEDITVPPLPILKNLFEDILGEEKNSFKKKAICEVLQAISIHEQSTREPDFTVNFTIIKKHISDNLLYNILPTLKFVKDIPEYFICVECRGLLKWPQQLDCGHRICKDCVGNFIAKAPINENGVKYCPEDKCEFEYEIFPDLSALKEIMLFECECVNGMEGCQWIGPFYFVEKHIDVCAFGMQMGCEFEGFSCLFRGTKKQMEQHMSNSVYLHHNLVSLNVAAAENSGRALSAGSMISRFHQRIDEISKEFGKVQIIDDVADNVSPNSEDLSNKIGEFYNKFESIKKAKERLDDVLRKNEKLTELASKGADASHRTEILEKKVQQLESSHEANKKKVEQFAIKTMLFQSTTYNGSYLWKLDNFRARLMDALDTKRNTSKSLELFTPPLYTKRFGYKFCAKMILNGGATHEHISFYIIVMKGDYDEALQWPFPYVINATLINLDSKKNIKHTLVPDRDMPNFRKPTKELNPAIGFARFCSHDSLHIDNFVISDAIFIQIEVEVDSGILEELSQDSP